MECIEKRKEGSFFQRTLSLGSLPQPTHALSISCSTAHGQRGSLRQCKDARVQLVSVTDGVQQRTRRCFYISIWSITSSLQRSKHPEQEGCKAASESHIRSKLFKWSVYTGLQTSNKCWQNLDKNLFSKWIDVLYRWSAQFAKLTWSLMSITAFLLARSVFCFGCFCEIISNVFKIPQITFSHHCWHVNTADWNFSVTVT